MLKKNLAIFCLVGLSYFYAVSTSAQNSAKALVNDVELQFEITEAMNLLYNFKFNKADSLFQSLKSKHSKHPLPYFLLGYSQYWRILPNEDISVYDDKFYAYMDTVIELAGKLYDSDSKNFEAIFFLTAGHAFIGRRRSDNKQWSRATFNGSKALHYLKLGREFNEMSPEFLIGEGLFNYYVEWIPENYKAFKPVMWFFPNGDKMKGVALLKQSSQNAFYSRVEAQHYLIRILVFEEKKDSVAYPIIKLLNQTYPDNPIFERLFARLLFSIGNYSECLKVSESILTKIEAKQLGYEEVSGRYASFFIGWISRYRDKAKSKLYFEKSVAFSEHINATKMNYYLYSLEALAQFAEENKDNKLLKIYLSKINENANRDHELYKKTKKKLKTLQND
ncbi:MAG: tol-pal system protein YbgF [Cytophagales bacterium]